MTTFETLRLFVAIVAIYAVPAAIFWYLVDRKIKKMEETCCAYAEYFLDNISTEITTINTRLRNIT